jgi:CheY-like chemotaxis protein
MGGTIRLDETYDSGVPGCPGTRFIVDLKRPPTEFDSEMESYVHDNAEYSNGVLHIGESALVECEALPGKLSALFVDDDPILRKLFARTVRTVAPDWQIREASSGEAALRLVAIEKFDVIFCDMYMASVEKSLLGTETVELMRKKGVKCRICGLSANDKEKEFLEAGADCFTLKPFPCERNALTRELCRILNQQTPADV